MYLAGFLLFCEISRRFFSGEFIDPIDFHLQDLPLNYQYIMATKFNAENAENLEEIEKQFAVKAVLQAETYWKLISNVKASTCKLTQHDDEIYTALMEDFPEFQEKEKVSVISEEEMKSPAGKARWRTFCEKFKEIDDYNFGTLLRTRSDDEYTQENSIFAVRIQFYAIEIARNRMGLNDWASSH